MQKASLDLFLTLYTYIEMKQIICVPLRAKTIQLLEENIGENPYNFGLDKYFLDRTQKAQTIKTNK